MTERTKLVVRHLPPNLPEDAFWKTLAPWIKPQEGSPIKCVINYKAYVQGKWKVDLPSRAYIQFATVEDLVEFNKGYSQQAFRDSRGNITVPKIEFAPFRKIPGPAKRADIRCGTIDSDHDYQAFLKRLESPKTANDDANTEAIGSTEERPAVEVPKITPLIEHLRSLRKVADEVAAAAKNPQRNITATSKASTTRRLEVPTQIIKRSSSPSDPSAAHSFLSSAAASSQKKIESTPRLSSSKPPKLVQQSSSCASRRSRSPVFEQEPGPRAKDSPAGLSKSERRQKMGGEALQPSGGSQEVKPVPKTIVTRPKQILTKSTGPSTSQQQTDSQNAKVQVSSSQSQKVGGSAMQEEGKGGKKVKQPPKSSPQPQGHFSAPETTPQSSSPRPKQAENETGEPRALQPPRGAEEAAGARKTLGMALAGTGARTDRRTSRRKRGGAGDGPPA